jgi:RHS repeat-associated protein
LVWPDPTARHDTPEVGTAYLWDGDQLAAEAPLHLGGRIDWARAVKWHYEDGGFAPIVKALPDGAFLHIVSDHLGTPREMFDAKGALVWSADHHVWGAVRTARAQGSLAPKPSPDPHLAELHCPFRFPGQYEDAETGLYYNRHRHYDPLTGQYASPDPIGLAGGDRPQGYVSNPSVWVDPFGLSAALTPAQLRQHRMLADYVGYNVSPMGTDKYSHVGRQGTYVTDKQAITDIIGPFPKSRPIVVQPEKIADLEKALGLTPGSLKDGFKIREVKGISSMSPRSPMEGNNLFLGPGQHVPGGGPVQPIIC